MNPQPLKTAAQCEAHGERTYACVNCGASVTRKACETWHCDQCDACIVRWAYDKAVRDADKAITEHAPQHIHEWHAQNVKAWRKTMIDLGLILERFP